MTENSSAAPAPGANMGAPIARTESVAKVTGRIPYATDVRGKTPLEAYFLTSAIARGQPSSRSTRHRRGACGRCKSLHARTMRRSGLRPPIPKRAATPPIPICPSRAPRFSTMARSSRMVIAESYEIARDASHGSYAAMRKRRPRSSLVSPG